MIFFQDKQYIEWMNATKHLFNGWAGRKPGEPMIKLWGSLRDVLRGGQDFKGYLRQQIFGITILNAYKMSGKGMTEYVKRINHIKPRLLLTFPNSINELACFIQENYLSIYSPPAIMTSGGILYPEVKARIEEVFQAPVFNRYGSREVGDIACNCRKNQGLHIIPNIHYIEILDNRDKEVKAGEAGEIVITSLTNYTMPLIRYKIEDRGILSKKECCCGRGFPLLKKVEGRVRSMFINKQGDLIDSASFIRLFYFRDNIQQFQVIQESLDLIAINLVLKNQHKLKLIEKDLREISEVVKQVMGDDIKIKYSMVNEIKYPPSGKYMHTFSKIKNEGMIQTD